MSKTATRILLAAFVLVSVVAVSPAMGVSVSDADATEGATSAVDVVVQDCTLEPAPDGVSTQCGGGGGNPCHGINDPYTWC